MHRKSFAADGRYRSAGWVGAALIFLSALSGSAQQRPAADANTEARIQALSDAMNRVETQMREAQRQLDDIKQQLSALRGTGVSPAPSEPEEPTGAEALSQAVASLRENQSMSEAQIATLEQSKVETASKYPLKLSGMVLMTGFVNTRRVDTAASPTIALGGGGSTGASFRQTIVGLDINGPHVFGARSHADVRFDLSGDADRRNYTGTSLLRLRTAHSELTWDRTRLFFAFDRPLLNPETPASIVAVAEPALAWSGNLWAWNPQFGVSTRLFSTPSGLVQIEAALTDIGAPPPIYAATQGSFPAASTAELSRWPGAEGRIGYEDARQDRGLRFGLSGLFAPHRDSVTGSQYDSWAGAVDFHLPISRFTQLSGNAYTGAGLGSLGGGAYKDSVLRTAWGENYLSALDDRGGWVQWKQRPGERLEFNEAFGIDNVPAHQLRPFADSTPVSYYNLTRNRTFSGNAIYSPNAYLLFSLEYRRIASSYVTSPTEFSDVIGIAAGYQF